MKSETRGAVTTLTTGEKEETFFLSSDIHIDSISCARKKFFSDLDKAVDMGAWILLFGDTYDAMNGRFDPRRSMENVRKEHRVDKYYDAIVDDTVGMLEKYAKNILMISDGNHELAVLKNANTHLIDRTVSALNKIPGTNIVHGGYGGWIRIMHKGGEKIFDGTYLMKYFHGSGGEAPVSRGVLQTARQAVFLPDADIVVNGHSHNSYLVPITRERVSGKGVHYFDTQYHVRTPGYSQGYGDGSVGWEVTRGGVPKPLGSMYMKTFSRGHHDPSEKRIEFQQVIHSPEPIKNNIDLYRGIIFPQE